jgi:hypothetical protein
VASLQITDAHSRDMSMTLSETMRRCYEARELPTWGDILNAAGEIDRLSRQLAEARAGCRAALNMVDGNGFPPDWDRLRKIVSQEDAAHAAAMGTKE